MGDTSGMAQRRKFAEQVTAERIKATERWYREGGYWFTSWVKKWYRRWSGEPLHWKEPWQEEYYLLLGTPHIERVIVIKGAQVGYSESLIALTAFALTAARIPTGFGFEAERKLRDMVPRIQTSFDHCEPIQRSKIARRASTGRKDVDYKERQLTIAGTSCTFFYTSTQKGKGAERQASSAMSSFTAWLICADEIELWPDGCLDVATERQSACELPTKPFRAGSTPGHEGGIVDAQVKGSGRVFGWYCTCSKCGKGQLIHPFGNFLKGKVVTNEDGSTEEVFLDPVGRPYDWFYHDGASWESKIDSAYVGCRECGQELSWDDRAAGEFRCRNTGVQLRAFCDDLINNQKYCLSPCAIDLPRLASIFFNPSERIRKLTSTRNAADQLQQGLGVACSIGGGKISLQRLQRCVGLKLPESCDRPPDLVVVGVDQGPAFNYGIRESWWLGTEGDHEQRWLDAHVQVDWWGDLIGFEGIEEHGKKHEVDLIGIDGEPEVQLAGAFTRKYPPGHPKPRPTRHPMNWDGSYDMKLRDPQRRVSLEAFLKQHGWEHKTSWVEGRDVVGFHIKRAGENAIAIEELDRLIRQNFYAEVDKLTDEEINAPRDFKVFLFDQVYMKGEDFRRNRRVIQNIEIPVFSIHRTAFLDAVRNRIYRNQFHLPASTQYVPGDADNLMVHFLSSDRQNNGMWVQTPGVPDHYLHAANFCEAVVMCALYEKPKKRLLFSTV